LQSKRLIRPGFGNYLSQALCYQSFRHAIRNFAFRTCSIANDLHSCTPLAGMDFYNLADEFGVTMRDQILRVRWCEQFNFAFIAKSIGIARKTDGNSEINKLSVAIPDQI
jgi:hypothetical protein